MGMEQQESSSSNGSASSSKSISLAKEFLLVVTTSRQKSDEQRPPCLSICRDLFRQLQSSIEKNNDNEDMKALALVLKQIPRACRRWKRQDEAWTALVRDSQSLLSKFQKSLSKKTIHSVSLDCNKEDAQGLSVSSYTDRLRKQGKDLYKNPAVLPPPSVVIEPTKCPLPKRNKKTGALTFVAKSDEDPQLKEALKIFQPNQTPEEVLRAGAFGGTYFRSITSAVTNQRYTSSQVIRDTLPKEWIDGLDVKLHLTSSKYQQHVNRYGVKCGGSLGMWESSGWISDADPYGWFQWYCRFYQGRRCSDDVRQIRRWSGVAGPKGRFRSQLCNKVLSKNAAANDSSISPVIRQTLLHWGLEITEDILKQHEKRMTKK